MKPIPYSHYTKTNNVKANSNFADYVTHKPYVSCGWMDFHNDKEDWTRKTNYCIKVHYVHPNAVFVHNVDGNYVLEELSTGSEITFNHKKMHALLPRKLAEKIVSENRINIPGYRKWVKKIDGNAFKAKLIWEWNFYFS